MNTIKLFNYEITTDMYNYILTNKNFKNSNYQRTYHKTLHDAVEEAREIELRIRISKNDVTNLDESIKVIRDLNHSFLNELMKIKFDV